MWKGEEEPLVGGKDLKRVNTKAKKMNFPVLFLIFIWVARNGGCIMNYPTNRQFHQDVQTANLFPESNSNQRLEHTWEEKGQVQTESHFTSINNLKMEVSSSSGNLSESGTQMIYFIIKNEGDLDEFVKLSLSDTKGYEKEIMSPSEFHLPKGAFREIPVKIQVPAFDPQDISSRDDSSESITLHARGKRDFTERSFLFPNQDYHHDYSYGPICYDRYVTGNCRYRSDPIDCLSYEWTAYATLQSPKGLQSIQSIPDGLYIPPEFNPGTSDRVRVFLKVSCCTPYVQFTTRDLYFHNERSACVVDVQELQGLHPGEIAGIVIGCVLLLIIIIVIVAILFRRRSSKTILVGHSSHGHVTRSREYVSRE